MFRRKLTLKKLSLMMALVIVWAGPGPFAVAVAADKVKETPAQMLYVTEGTFEEVKENVDLAITGQGLVINSIAIT